MDWVVNGSNQEHMEEWVRYIFENWGEDGNSLLFGVFGLNFKGDMIFMSVILSNEQVLKLNDTVKILRALHSKNPNV